MKNKIIYSIFLSVFSLILLSFPKLSLAQYDELPDRTPSSLRVAEPTGEMYRQDPIVPPAPEYSPLPKPTTEKFYGYKKTGYERSSRNLSQDDMWIPITLMLVIVGIVLGSMILWIWMLVDVVKRKPANDVVWVLIIALTGLIGAVIYLFAVKIPDDRSKRSKLK